jgi:hypothetical protein
MAQREIILHVDTDGKAQVAASGFEGGTCLDATAAFEALFSKTEAPREMVGECAGGKDFGERVR